jgi:DNA-binding winged helix-turn-helix (wHTH) protein
MQPQPITPKEQRAPMRGDMLLLINPQTSPAAADATLEFGRFRILLRRRQLLADGVPVKLGTRAFDLLMVLIEADGLLVTKDEILARVWPGIVVEESNLKIHICTLRKALGDDRDFIRTETGRGYRFTAAIRSTAAPPDRVTAPDAAEPRVVPNAASPTDLSAIALRLVHLEAELAEVLNLLIMHQIEMPTGSGRTGNAGRRNRPRRRVRSLSRTDAFGKWRPDRRPSARDSAPTPAAEALASGGHPRRAKRATPRLRR